jgi:hypothetical protein
VIVMKKQMMRSLLVTHGHLFRVALHQHARLLVVTHQTTGQAVLKIAKAGAMLCLAALVV